MLVLFCVKLQIPVYMHMNYDLKKIIDQLLIKCLCVRITKELINKKLLQCYSCVLSVRLQRLQAITCGQGLSSASMRRVHTTPNTMTNLVLPTPPGPSECLICSELALLVLFCPCQHSVACEGGWRRELVGIIIELQQWKQSDVYTVIV